MKPTDVSHLNQLQFTGRISFAAAAAARTALRGDTIEVSTAPLERVNLRKAVAKPRAQRTWVKMFQLRFVPKVAAGKKRTTIRPKPQRPQDWPVVGDRIEARHWLGKPYKSKHKTIITGVITSVQWVTITVDGITLWNVDPDFTDNTMQPAKVPGLSLNAINRMAKADGFHDWFEMRTWFRNQHGLPFTGILIEWGKPECRHKLSTESRVGFVCRICGEKVKPDRYCPVCVGTGIRQRKKSSTHPFMPLSDCSACGGFGVKTWRLVK